MKNHPFARHGIEHLSPSSIALWRGAPALWTLRYLNNVKDDGNAAMWRGTAVENGLASLLRGETLEYAVRQAQDTFELNAMGEASEEVNSERRLIAPMVETCCRWHVMDGQPQHNAAQLRVEHWFDDFPIPVIGYVDFCFDEGDLDLKSTKACPSKPRPDNVRQVAFYMAARQKPGALLYVTDKKWAYFPIEKDDAERALLDLEACARSLMAFLAKVDNGREALSCLPFDPDHYAASEKITAAYISMMKGSDLTILNAG